MRLALAIVVLLVFALSLVADHKWRKWMSQRRADHNHTDETPRP
jgi:hypothetical protein